MKPQSPVDIVSPAGYENGIPHGLFAELRRHEGLVWHPYEDNGFWAVTRHHDVRTVSRAPEIFSSGVGHTNLWDLEADALQARRSIIDSDPPDHTRLRRLVSRSFTPRAVRRWEETTRQIAQQALDNFDREGGGDWVDLVAAPLPIQVILTMLGVPLADSSYLVELSNYLVEGTTDQPSLAPDAFGNTTPLRLLPFASPASHALFEYGEQLAAERRANPGEDLVTQLVQAEDDGDRLTHDEYRNMFHVLVFAGNETTRTAITHGVMALADHPDQWDRLVHDPSLIDNAVEEVIRWATPVLHMRRTATEDTEVAGTTIKAGEKVVMWYASSNRDEAVFDHPHTFDIGRADNPHQSFGGTGPHFCLGAYLARMEVRILLEEMLARQLKVRRTSPPIHLPSNFVHGVLSVEMERVS